MNTRRIKSEWMEIYSRNSLVETIYKQSNDANHWLQTQANQIVSLFFILSTWISIYPI